MASARVSSLRYKLLKIAQGAEEFLYEFMGPASSKSAGVSSAFQTAVQKFNNSVASPLTTQMYIAGSAMAPTLNRRALEEKDVIEKVNICCICILQGNRGACAGTDWH